MWTPALLVYSRTTHPRSTPRHQPSHSTHPVCPKKKKKEIHPRSRSPPPPASLPPPLLSQPTRRRRVLAPRGIGAPSPSSSRTPTTARRGGRAARQSPFFRDLAPPSRPSAAALASRPPRPLPRPPPRRCRRPSSRRHRRRSLITNTLRCWRCSWARPPWWHATGGTTGVRVLPYTFQLSMVSPEAGSSLMPKRIMLVHGMASLQPKWMGGPPTSSVPRMPAFSLRDTNLVLESLGNVVLY